MIRRFELVEGKSSKFWEVEHDPESPSYVVRWGRIGTKGQEKATTTRNAASAAGEVDRLVKEKTRKGYSLAGGAVPAASAPAPEKPEKPAKKAKVARKAAPPAEPEPPPAPSDDDPRRFEYVSVVEALREPHRVHHLSLTKPSAFDPVPDEELAALARLGELTKLETLVLSYVDHPLPPLGGLAHLRRLILAGSGLTRLPEGIEQLAELEDLGLSSNPALDLRAAFRALTKLPKLRTLRLGGNDFQGAPEEIADLSHVDSLLISGPPSKMQAIARMPSLRELFLMPSDEEGLPELLRALAAVPSLRVLSLSARVGVPDEIGALAQLERLGLSLYSRTTTLPDLSGLTALRVLDVDGGKIKKPERKKIAARIPHAEVHWDGTAPDDREPEPAREVRRVPDATGMSRFEQLFGRSLPEGIPANPPAPQIVPPDGENAFEWLLARDQDGGPFYLHLLPFFLDCAPLDESLPNGDFVYAHFDPSPSPSVEHYLFLHDEGDPLALVPVGDAKALNALYKRADAGDLSMPKKVKVKGRVPALLERSRWIMDLLARGETTAPIVVGDDDALAEVWNRPGFADDPADLLYWLWSAYLGERDAWILGLCEVAEASKSRVVRDAAKVVSRLHRATKAKDRRLGSIADAAKLRQRA